MIKGTQTCSTPTSRRPAAVVQMTVIASHRAREFMGELRQDFASQELRHLGPAIGSVLQEIDISLYGVRHVYTVYFLNRVLGVTASGIFI